MSIFNGTADDIFNKKTDYPEGSVCMFNTNIDPNEMYGGTWVRIKGKFIFGADDDTYPLGSEGGEVTHTLTVSEIPAHVHYYNSHENGYPLQHAGEDNYKTPLHDLLYNQNTTRDGTQTNSTGGSQPHNNMPPYVAFYIWAKVA